MPLHTRAEDQTGQSNSSPMETHPNPTRQVAALGRLEPTGKVIAVAAPPAASDAPLSELHVAVGDAVAANDLLATFANAPRLEAHLRRAHAELQVHEVELERVRNALRLEKLNAEAALRIAQTELADAERVLQRQEQLSTSATASQASLDTARTQRDIQQAQLDQAEARLNEVAGDVEQHPDIEAARLAVARAAADVAIAQVEVDQTRLIAPISGVVLEIQSRAGERPGSGGIVRIADTSTMVVRMEVHQNRIHHVTTGAPVIVLGEALTEPLSGVVTFIGLEVLDQGLIGTDPVVTNNARVFEVEATLDAPSAQVAANLINLQVIATIEIAE
ncbi:HlyD family efflux transporter periplasmic adaptor subunit [Thalassococcus sp. S3]|uniref:HlyD family efflux transporter periplasmic adaptor subunit n=1 Tax=Thalassococcus sp. S3 TaxID=2017482 RepID=UPI0013EEA249|nr:HlyD family efflux transporter periplasmic adaptor subunit [Thalassococcus sp. S3]